MSRQLKMIVNFVIRLLGGAPEIPSPPNMIDMEDVSFVKDENGKTGTLTIRNVPVPFWAATNPWNTNSMDGFFDVGHCPLQVARESLPDEYLCVGQVVSWEKTLPDGSKIARFHQIIEAGEDEEGWYCYTAGLNVSTRDPWKIRKHEIGWIFYGLLPTRQSKKVIYVT